MPLVAQRGIHVPSGWPYALSVTATRASQYPDGEPVPAEDGAWLLPYMAHSSPSSSWFRSRWNRETERALVDRFRLDMGQKTSHLSKGQRTQLALVAAICPEPDLLVLDEPTSGLDPIVRREFIQTVIGAYQEGAPGERTVFVSTHLISEFEGLIDEFTIIDAGREVMTMDADAARQRYQKIYARFAGAPPAGLDLGGARVLRQRGRELEVLVAGNTADVIARLTAASPETIETEALTLEEIFVTALTPEGAVA